MTWTLSQLGVDQDAQRDEMSVNVGSELPS
jgi:hypothetical protein